MRYKNLRVALVIILINLLPCSRISSAAFQSTTVNVAWLVSEQKYHDVSKASSIGALALAVSKATNITGDTYNITWADPSCNKKDSVIALYHVLIEQRFSPDLLLGPQCSNAMAYVGKLAGFRNLPSFGWVSESFELRPDTYTYNTLVRVLPPVNSLGPGLLLVLDYFNWHHVTVISSETDSDRQYEELGEVVSKALSNDDKFNVIRHTSKVKSPADDGTIKSIFSVTKKEARIVIFCVPFSEMSSWMLMAYKMKMTDGDFVFIYVNALVPSPSLYHNITQAGFWRRGTSSDSHIEKAMRSLLILTMKPEDHNLTTQFHEEARQAARGSSQWITKLNVTPEPSDFFAPYLHDAFLLFTKLSAEARDIGCGYSNGSCILDRAQNRKFDGPDFITGKIMLDSLGDRIPEFWLLDMNQEAQFEVSLNISADIIDNKTIHEMHKIKEIVPIPPDIPKCGFQNEHCPKYELYIAVPLAVLVFIGLIAAAILLYRRYQFEQTIQNMAWKVNRKDLHVPNGLDRARNMSLSRFSVRGRHRGSLGSVKNSHHHAITKDADTSSILTSENDQIFINTAKYRNTTVAIKKVINPKLTFDRKILVEMTHMTELKHNNLATFIGATTEPPEFFEVWEYCSKGSLQDIIWNDTISLDNMFKFSIIIDILTGLKYLHDSRLKMHGKLKSSNIVVDGRWMCKLTDYGLFMFRNGQQQSDLDAEEQKAYSQLYWTAPELLQEINEGRKLSTSSVLLVKGANKRQPVPMSQEGDIYASAIIIKEVITRTSPYTEYDYLTPKEIVERVRGDGANRFTFRPKLSEVSDKDLNKVMAVIRSGWSERPSDRPNAQQMLRDIQRINPFKSANVMDNMIRMMERYSNNLEEIVGERTQQLEEEKKKSETLLYRMLPRSMAEKLKVGEKVDAESYDAVTIYFSDIVKFTDLSAESTPLQVVTLLNGLYTLFDSTCSRHDVYKVETIGDAYMLVSGLPVRNGDRHAVEIANCALEILSGVLNFKVQHKPGHKLQIRIGLHTGPAVSGIVGLTMPRYCLFGSTVSQTSLMESGGMPLRIHLSEMTYQLLSKFSGYHLALRGSVIEMKGIGLIKSYWLYGRDKFNGPLPDFDDLISADSPKAEILPVTVGKDPTISGLLKTADPEKSNVIKASNDEVQTLKPEKPIIRHSGKKGANALPATDEQSQGVNNKDSNPASTNKTYVAFSNQDNDAEKIEVPTSPVTYTATEKSSDKKTPSVSLAAGTAMQHSPEKSVPPISPRTSSSAEKFFKKTARTVSPLPDSPKMVSNAEKSVEKIAPTTEKSPEKTASTNSSGTASPVGEEHQEPQNSASATVVLVKPSLSVIKPSNSNTDARLCEQESIMLPRFTHVVQPSEPASKSSSERVTQEPFESQLSKQFRVTSANGTTEVKFNLKELNFSEITDRLNNHQATEFKFKLRDRGMEERQRAGEQDNEMYQTPQIRPFSARKTSLLNEEEARGRAGRHHKKKLWNKAKSTSNRVGMESRAFASDNAAFIQENEDHETSSSDHNSTTASYKRRDATVNLAWDTNGSTRDPSDEELRGKHEAHQQKRKRQSKSNERAATMESYTGDILGKLKTHTSRKPKNKKERVKDQQITGNVQMNEDINLNTIGSKAEDVDLANNGPLFYSMPPKSTLTTKAPISQLPVPGVTVADCLD